MKQFRKILPVWVVSLGIFLSCFSLSAQNSFIGREFMFSVLGEEAESGEVPTVFVTISAAYPDDQVGNVVITVPSTNVQQTFEYNGRLTQAPIGWGYQVDEKQFASLQEGKDPFSIHIQSDIDVTVLLTKHFDGREYDHGDGTMVLPIKELGTQYYVMSHNELSGEFNSEVVVVATADDTFIDITPSVDTREHAAGFPFTIKLDRGERFQIQSKEDLTGTFIELNTSRDQNCKPFAVFSGAARTTVGSTTLTGHVFSQIYSIEKWAHTFSLLPFEVGNNEYLVKVLAYENNTRVNFITKEGTTSKTIASGQYETMTLTEAVKIVSDKKILVAQYFMGFTEDGIKVDPFMLLPIGDEQFSSELSLNWAPNMSFRRLVQQADPNASIPPFHSIIMYENDTGNFTHDTRRFESNMATYHPDSSLVYSNFYPALTFDGLNMRNKSPHAMHLFTFGRIPYSVNLGIKANVDFLRVDSARTNPLTFDISPIVNITNDFACLTENLLFTSKYFGKDSNNPPLSFFEWDFGDGTIEQGEDLSHQYAEEGTYTVSLRTKGMRNGCLAEEIVNKQITVVDTRIKKFNGATEVCPFAQNAVYSVEAHPENTYIWEVVGGSLVSSSENQAIVNWDGGNANAQVKVISSNPYSCQSEEVILNVNVDPNSLPGIPQGRSTVCTNENVQEYTVPFTFENSVYDWEVTNGQIIEGNGTEKIKVEWQGTGKGTLVYKKSSQGQSAGCDGESPVLEVDIVEAAELNAEVVHITCEGSTDGEIRLRVPSSSGPYQVKWADGSLGLVRTGLDIGDYQATITDGSGCVIEWSGSITKQNILDMNLNITDGSCFGANDGSAIVNITGGVEPYQIFWDKGLKTQGFSASQVNPGEYKVRVVDARGCEIKGSFIVDEPEVFEASVSKTSTCPGESTGALIVNAWGGQGPYEYSWNGGPFSSEFQRLDIPAGTHDILVRDASGCQVQLNGVSVEEVQQHLKLPTAFSPNGDNINDIFEPIFDCSVTSFLLQIYSKWGEVVYSSDQFDGGWDGKFEGQPLTGTFTYIAKYTTLVNGTDVGNVYRGSVRIIR